MHIQWGCLLTFSPSRCVGHTNLACQRDVFEVDIRWINSSSSCLQHKSSSIVTMITQPQEFISIVNYATWLRWWCFLLTGLRGKFASGVGWGEGDSPWGITIAVMWYYQPRFVARLRSKERPKKRVCFVPAGGAVTFSKSEGLQSYIHIKTPRSRLVYCSGVLRWGSEIMFKLRNTHWPGPKRVTEKNKFIDFFKFKNEPITQVT
jgi:hypothetical protein